MRRLGFSLLAFLCVSPAMAAETLTVRPETVSDEKAVFATVESANVVPARARIGGTVAALSVRAGDPVTPGQVIAVVGDEKLLLTIAGLDAQIAVAQSQVAQAQTDLTRADALARQGAGTRVALDQARTAVEVAGSALKARTAERDVARQQQVEGQVLAPVAGRVLTVPVTQGTVVLGGDPVASIAEAHYILRLRVPERHAATLRAGDPVRVDPADLGRDPGQASAQGNMLFGKVTLVYPTIQEGRFVADAEVPGLGDFFVGERIRVWIGAGERTAFVVPAGYLVTRFGLDYARVQQSGGTVVETPVQRGQPRPTPAMQDGLEILSGLRAADILVKP